ncbi:MAG TPA: SPOR domain-containing protein [Vicinamibacterales bacterium]|nr:SPOR domain-containing protein [Vicinamibacterales bacterium]
MRQCLAAVLVALALARTGYAQQGHVQLAVAAHAVAADAVRRAGQPTLEPDIGLTVYRPTLRAGNLFADIHLTPRDGKAHLGQVAVAVRDVKAAGLTWTLSGGDSSTRPVLGEYGFPNLFAPYVTFVGGSLSGVGPRGSIAAMAGRVTALQNLFGSDPQMLDQRVAELQARVRPTSRLELLGRASRVRTRDVREFAYYVDAGDSVGIGARLRVVPTLELTADGGVSWFERRGSGTRERGPDALVGAQWIVRRGWLQLNAQRFSPGYFAVVNTPFLDRQGAFAAGEYVVWSRLRLFGGFELFETNLDPEAADRALASLPDGETRRGYGGLRVHLGGRTFVTLRAEDGDRAARPTGLTRTAYDSDTGVVSTELQTGSRTVSAFGRYERRENVDNANGQGTYTQHTANAQVFSQMSQRSQIFASAMFLRRADRTGGQTFWHAGGGAQWQLPRRQLWLRGEGLFSLNSDWASDVSIPHQLLTVGLSGQLTLRTTVTFDVSFDRAPQPIANGSPWLTRSMLRLRHTVHTGAARVGGAAAVASRRRGGGTIAGVAYADWNANGLQDAGEEGLAGVSLLYGAGPGASAGTQVTTGLDGQFAFVDVPLGRATVGLDIAALPVDYDPPPLTRHDTDVSARGGARLAFGLVPLGSISGVVVEDADNDGKPGAADAPVGDAVVVLDGGARSEQTRAGAFRFDAVRPGAHTVELLRESLPEACTIVSSPIAEIEVSRARLHGEAYFLVKFEKRPEIRRTFPAKKEPAGPGSPASRAPDASTSRTTPTKPAPVAPKAAAKAAGPAPAQRAPATSVAPDVPRYAIQFAALRNRTRARQMAESLRRRGVEAYVLEDVDRLAKVRVGSYESREEAERELLRLQQTLRIEGVILRTGG